MPTRPPACLFGAVTGDVIGSVYEFRSQKEYDFELITERSSITDDGILTIAVADAILQGGAYGDFIRRYAQRHPNPMGGYGARFQDWVHSPDPQPYNSFGNGSAMRVSAIGWVFESVDDVLREAEASAACTHNHPEGIKGAQAAALAVFMARKRAGKAEIKRQIMERFGYDLRQTLDEIRPTYRFNESCQGTVPQAIIAFLEGEDFEDAIRKAVSLGGDADTLAAITGGIAEAFHGGVPAGILQQVQKCVPPELWHTAEKFGKRFDIPVEDK